MLLSFTYAGTVELTHDPLKLGRLKVRVPHVNGTENSGAGYMGVNDLPWALPAGMPAGGSAKSGGFSHLPAVGDKVWVRFLDGEPEKPIWEWGMQSVDDADALPLHSYDIGTPVGDPDRGFWTRYGHAVELNEGSVIATTSLGYRIVLTDGSAPGVYDGNISVTTPNGNSLSFDDLDDTLKVMLLGDAYVNVMEGFTGISDSYTWSTMTGDYVVNSGGALSLTATENVDITSASALSVSAIGDLNLSTEGFMGLEFSQLSIGLGATEPVVLGHRLETWILSLFEWLSLHTHTSGLPGMPTTQPLQPVALIQPSAENLLSTTVTVQS